MYSFLVALLGIFAFRSTHPFPNFLMLTPSRCIRAFTEAYISNSLDIISVRVAVIDELLSEPVDRMNPGFISS